MTYAWLPARAGALGRSCLVLFVWLGAHAATAHAQTCAPGRVLGPTTAGHCCWPAQSWSDERGRCIGAPDCPAGWGGDGERCAALDDDPVLRVAAAHEGGPSIGMIAGGVVLFVTSYFAAIPFGVSLVVSSPCSDSGVPYTIPFASTVGAAMLQACSESYSPTFAALGVAFGVGQLVAVALFAVGLQPRHAPAGAAVRWSASGLSVAF